MTRPAWETPPYNVVSVSLGGLVTLTNVGAAYDATAGSKGLGFAVVDFTNVTAVDFTVHVNKAGTGTQSWQLWNETDGTQVAVIDDAAAVGDNKILTTTAGVNLSGLKKIRVRAKSTTAADDPVYYGACAVLR
jgi:hypothetical protein